MLGIVQKRFTYSVLTNISIHYMDDDDHLGNGEKYLSRCLAF